MDINPATRGHALVVPRAHADDLYELPAEDVAATALAAQRLALRARDALGADGVNLLNSCRAGGLADRLPLPRARDPALRRTTRCGCRGCRGRATPTRSPPARRCCAGVTATTPRRRSAPTAGRPAKARNGRVELSWFEQGEGEPLVLIMGLGGSSQAWYRLLPLLGPDVRAIAFDNRGTGRSRRRRRAPDARRHGRRHARGDGRRRARRRPRARRVDGRHDRPAASRSSIPSACAR